MLRSTYLPNSNIYLYPLRRYERRYKITKMGVVWGSYGSLNVTDNSAIRHSAYDFLLVFHSNCVPIMHCFRDIARSLSKNRRFEPTPSLLGAPLELPRWNFAHTFGNGKLESMGYRMMLFTLAFSAFGIVLAYDRRTDRQTDRRTHDDSIYRASIESLRINQTL